MTTPPPLTTLAVFLAAQHDALTRALVTRVLADLARVLDAARGAK